MLSSEPTALAAPSKRSPRPAAATARPLPTRLRVADPAWRAAVSRFELLTGGARADWGETKELVAAREGKFAHLPDHRMNYAYQLDSTLYAKFLRAMAEAHGIKRIEGKIANVELDGESGDIAALVLDSGARIEGELFLDCTDFRAILIA